MLTFHWNGNRRLFIVMLQKTGWSQQDHGILSYADGRSKNWRYSPFQFGLRFSAKARGPSIKSLE